MCQEVTELDLTDWKARIEGKGVEVLPEVNFHNTKQDVGLVFAILFGSTIPFAVPISEDVVEI